MGAGDVRQASRDDAVHRFARLEQADDVVNTNTRTLDDGMAAAHAWLARNVAITDGVNLSIHGSNHTLAQCLKRANPHEFGADHESQVGIQNPIGAPASGTAPFNSASLP